MRPTAIEECVLRAGECELGCVHLTYDSYKKRAPEYVAELKLAVEPSCLRFELKRNTLRTRWSGNSFARTQLRITMAELPSRLRRSVNSLESHVPASSNPAVDFFLTQNANKMAPQRA